MEREGVTRRRGKAQFWGGPEGFLEKRPFPKAWP